MWPKLLLILQLGAIYLRSSVPLTFQVCVSPRRSARADLHTYNKNCISVDNTALSASRSQGVNNTQPGA